MNCNKYHKRFIESFSSENVIGIFSRYKNASKEITESWAMLEAARKYSGFELKCRVVVVGDGCSPRTGMIFAYYTKCKVISVDPRFNMMHWMDHLAKQTKMGFKPERISIRVARIEDLKIDALDNNLIVIWPHSHAKVGSDKITGYNSRVDIAMPCCTPIPKKWMEIPHLVYDDYNVLSPKRTIHVWKGAMDG